MKNFLHSAFVSALILFFNFSILAQVRRGPTLSLGGQVVQPVGEFALQYDGYPAGFAGNFTAPVGRSPFEFGFGYAWNNMGSQNKEINAYAYTDSSGADIYEEGTMRIRSNINRYQAIGRFRPFAGRIQPYVDAFAGIEAYKTKTDITLDNQGYSSASNSTRQHLDMTYSYGWAAGLRFQLAPSIFMEGRFENITGGMVKYVDEASIVVHDDNTITFDTRQSATNKYTYQLGIAIGF